MIKYKIYSSAGSTYRVGERIQYDTNYLGVTPKIHEGEILSIDRSLASHGTPSSYVYKVKDEDGKVYNVDEAAIIAD